MKTFLKWRKLISFLVLAIYCVTWMTPVYAAPNSTADDADNATQTDSILIQETEDMIGRCSGFNGTFTHINSINSENTAVIFIGDPSISNISIRYDYTSYEGSGITYLICVPDSNNQAQWLQPNSDDALFAFKYVDSDGDSHIVTPVYNDDHIWTGEYSIDVEDESSYTALEDRMYNPYDYYYWNTVGNSEGELEANNVVGTKSWADDWIFTGSSGSSISDEELKNLAKQTGNKLIKISHERSKNSYVEHGSTADYKLKSGDTISVEEIKIPSEGAAITLSNHTVFYWPNSGSNAHASDYTFYCPYTEYLNNMFDPKSEFYSRNPAVSISWQKNDMMKAGEVLDKHIDQGDKPATDTTNLNDVTTKYLHSMAQAAFDKDGQAIGKDDNELGHVVNDMKYSDMKNDISSVDSWSDWESFGNDKGINKGLLKSGILMQGSMFDNSDSTFMKDIGGDGEYFDFVKQMTASSQDDKPKVDAGDQDVIEKIWKDNAENTTLRDYAATIYPRMSFMVQFVSDAKFIDNYTYTADIKSWINNTSKIDWGTKTYMSLDGTPIMIDDTYFNNKYVDLHDDNNGGYKALGRLNRVVGEFGAYATTWRESIKDNVGADEMEILQNMKKCVDTYSKYFPAIKTAWEYGDPSLSKLCNGGSDDMDEEGGDVDIDHPQPLEPFFTINTLGVNVPGLNDPWKWFNEEAQGNTPVLLSDYMKQGIAYSAGYVPMMTNVYTSDVILKQDDTFNREFHYKYGFMRKAIYIDTSATSVQTYYNTHGRSTAAKRICTLKKLFECAKNDQEVLLTIDDNFYNVDQIEDAISKRTTEQQARIENAYGYALAAQNTPQGAANSFVNDPIGTAASALGKAASAVGNALTGGDATDAGDASNLSEVNGEQYGTGYAASSYTDAIDALYAVTHLENIQANFDLPKFIRALSDLKGSSPQYSEEVLKTGDFTQYKADVRNSVNYPDTEQLKGGNYVDANSPFFDENNPDNYCYTSYDIKEALSGVTVRKEATVSDNTTGWQYTTYNPYSPALSYAFVSAIYRDKSAFSLLQDCSNYSPIFMASSELPSQAASDKGISKTLQNTIYNWALLKNLESMSQITYTYSLDLESPIFCDIYGNILTASGLVIIPAASNATLWSNDWGKEQPGIGLYTCYGNTYHIPVTVDTQQLAYKWTPEETNTYWMPRSRILESDASEDSIDFANLNEYDEEAKELAIMYMDEFLMNDAHINWWCYSGIISEVMRGAPVESIDSAKEGLRDLNEDIDGITMAAKLERLENSLKNYMKQNSLFVIPDFTRVEHVEYFLAFVIKIMAILTVFVVIVLVYRDGAAGEIGPTTFGKTIWAIFLVFMSISMIPAIFQFTYYGSNKLLLQNESSRIAMFTQEKYQSGIEVGVTDTSVPSNTNDLMIQLDWVSIPWYDYLSEMIFGESLTQMNQLRERAYQSSVVARQPDVEMYNDGVYVSVTNVLDSLTLNYTYGSHLYEVSSASENSVETEYGDDNDIGSADDKNITIKNNSEAQSLSFYSPYYVFVKAIVSNINKYNYESDTYRYTTKYMSGSRPKTVGLCNAYFTSPYFMEDCSDIFHLYEVLDVTPPTDDQIEDPIFTTSEIEKMKLSRWYVNPMDEYNTPKRIENMDDYARNFIARNKDLMNKISDETFIKVFCLDCALHFNQLYGIQEASTYEIYNLDSNDLLRLAICKSDDAMLATPMSYARYVYTYGGEAGVITAAVLLLVMWAGSIIKPLCTVIVFLVIFISIFVNKVLFRRPGGFGGYLITGGLLCLTNIAHAVLLKLSTYLPSFGFPTFVCLMLLIALQVIYLVVLAVVTAIAVGEWEDAGYEHYKAQAQAIKAHKQGRMADQLSLDIPYHKDNHEYYNDLVNNYKRRHTNQNNEKID